MQVWTSPGPLYIAQGSLQSMSGPLEDFRGFFIGNWILAAPWMTSQRCSTPLVSGLYSPATDWVYLVHIWGDSSDLAFSKIKQVHTYQNLSAMQTVLFIIYNVCDFVLTCIFKIKFAMFRICQGNYSCMLVPICWTPSYFSCWVICRRVPSLTGSVKGKKMEGESYLFFLVL